MNTMQGIPQEQANGTIQPFPCSPVLPDENGAYDAADTMTPAGRGSIRHGDS